MFDILLEDKDNEWIVEPVGESGWEVEDEGVVVGKEEGENEKDWKERLPIMYYFFKH